MQAFMLRLCAVALAGLIGFAPASLLAGQAQPAASAGEDVTSDALIQALDPHHPKTRGLIVDDQERGSGSGEVHQASLSQIQFEFGSDRLTPAAEEVVRKLGEALSSDRLHDLRFEIRGHTDAHGTDAYNIELSRRRAESVKRFLVANFAIAPERLIPIGRGKADLAVPARPESAANRRVVVVTISGR